MTDEEILNAHGFTKEQAVDAIAKEPSERDCKERALIRDLVKGWMQ